MTDVINLRLAKKVLTIGVVAATILWSVGFAALVPLQTDAAAPQDGDLCKSAATGSAVYLIRAQSPFKKHAFLLRKFFDAWGYKDADVKNCDDLTTIDTGAPIPAVPALPHQPTTAAGAPATNKVYYINSQAVARHVPTEALAVKLWGAAWASLIVGVYEPVWSSMTTEGLALVDETNVNPTADKATVTDTASRNQAVGAKLSTSGSGSGATPTATPTGAATATPAAAELTASLASDSPVAGTAVAGQAIFELLKIKIDGTGTITSMKLQRGGVSADTTLASVFLYDGGKRVSDSASVANTIVEFNNLSIAVSGSLTLSVRSNIATGTSGQTINLTLTSLNGKAVSLAGVTHTISTATLAGADFAGTTLPSATTIAAASGVTVWQNTLTISTRAVTMRSLSLKNLGSTVAGDLKNFQLSIDGTVASTVAELSSDRTITFDFSASPKTLGSGGRVLKVTADLVGGASKTLQFSLRYAVDTWLVDSELNQAVLATAAGSTFTARSATSATVDTGTVSMVVASTSPTTNITRDATNVLIGIFELLASGEDMKVENLLIRATASAGTRGLDNGKVMLVNSDGTRTQLGSTSDFTDATDITFTFGSSLILKAGTKAFVEVYADAKSSTGASYVSGETVTLRASTGSSNGTGQVSLTASNVPGSNVTATARTITAATITGAKATGYGNQNMIAGTNNAKLGQFTLSTGSVEGVNLNTIVLNLSAAEAATITDLLIKNDTTGTQFGATKSSPSTANTFSGSLDISAGGTVTFTVYGNIKTGSNIGPWTLELDDTTGGTGLSTSVSVTVGSDVTLQTITLTTGTFTAAAGVSPTSSIVVAGATGVHVGTFDFTAQNSAFTVQELKVKVPANAATSVIVVILRYKDASGTTKTVSQALVPSSGDQSHATATFTGLDAYVGKDTTVQLEVLVDVATIASGASSGAQISVLLDGDEGFRAVDAGGTADTTLSGSSSDYASTNVSGQGLKVVRKTVFVLSSTAITDTLAAGADQTIARLTVTANAAGNVSFKKLVFAITKTAAITLDATTTVDLRKMPGNISVAGIYATTTGSLLTQTQMFASTSGGSSATSGNIIFVANTEEVIAAGGSQSYELRSTVGGLASGNNSVSARIPATATSATTAAHATIHTATGDSSESVTWSDRSNTAHTESTTDWTDDYLLEGLPKTLGNRQVNI